MKNLNTVNKKLTWFYLLTIMSVTAQADNFSVTNVGELTTAFACPNPPCTITILSNINLTTGLTIPTGAIITLLYGGASIDIQAGGAITVQSGASLTITGSQQIINLQGGSITNNGNIIVANTNIAGIVVSGGTINNNSAGIITINGPNGAIGFGGASTFTNDGAIVNNGTLSNGIATTFINNGEITGNPLSGMGTVINSVPAITGPANMSLAVGYGAASTGAYTVTGGSHPAQPLTVTPDNTYGGRITWNDANKTLDIAPGLAAGTYPVVLTAANGTIPNAKLTFTLTVNPPPTVRPTITGNRRLTLTAGYAATSTDAYTITGTSPVTVTITSDDAKITWNGGTKKLDIAEGLTPGEYTVVLRASNTAGYNTLTFVLTVEEKVYYIDIPRSIPGGAVASKTSNANPFLAVEGETVTLIVTPNTDYALETISAVDYNNASVSIPLSGTGLTRTFVMPAHHVSVLATFRRTGWEAAKQLIESATFTLTQQQAPDESAARYPLAGHVNELIKETGFVVSPYNIVIFSFTPATSGDGDTPDGINGKFEFRVSPPELRNSAYSSGTITASLVANTVVTAAALKAWVNNGVLYVNGITSGKPLSVYSLYGQLVYEVVAVGDNEEIRLSERGVYIVVSAESRIKIVN